MPKAKRTMKKKVSKTAQKKQVAKLKRELKDLQKRKKMAMALEKRKKALISKVKKSKKPLVVKSDSMQTPKSRKSIAKDRRRKALPPGRRISKSGRAYTEHRQNRSDKPKTRL